jgi:hypothetical protein
MLYIPKIGCRSEKRQRFVILKIIKTNLVSNSSLGEENMVLKSEHKKGYRFYKTNFDPDEFHKIKDMGVEINGPGHRNTLFHQDPRKAAMKHYSGETVDDVPGRKNENMKAYWQQADQHELRQLDHMHDLDDNEYITDIKKAYKYWTRKLK